MTLIERLGNRLKNEIILDENRNILDDDEDVVEKLIDLENKQKLINKNNGKPTSVNCNQNDIDEMSDSDSEDMYINVKQTTEGNTHDGNENKNGNDLDQNEEVEGETMI